MSTIFTKIINKEIKADIVYEDKLCLAFKDIQAQAPSHILLIPKICIPTLNDLEEKHQSLLGHLMLKIPEIAKTQKLNDGYRVVINVNEYGGQTVYHLHIHILGGRRLSWPPG